MKKLLILLEQAQQEYNFLSEDPSTLAHFIASEFKDDPEYFGKRFFGNYEVLKKWRENYQGKRILPNPSHIDYFGDDPRLGDNAAGKMAKVPHWKTVRDPDTGEMKATRPGYPDVPFKKVEMTDNQKATYLRKLADPKKANKPRVKLKDRKGTFEVIKTDIDDDVTKSAIKPLKTYVKGDEESIEAVPGIPTKLLVVGLEEKDITTKIGNITKDVPHQDLSIGDRVFILGSKGGSFIVRKIDVCSKCGAEVKTKMYIPKKELQTTTPQKGRRYYKKCSKCNNVEWVNADTYATPTTHETGKEILVSKDSIELPKQISSGEEFWVSVDEIIYPPTWTGFDQLLIPPESVLHRLTMPDEKFNLFKNYVKVNFEDRIEEPDGQYFVIPKQPGKTPEERIKNYREFIEKEREKIDKFLNRMQSSTPSGRVRYVFNLVSFAVRQFTRRPKEVGPGERPSIARINEPNPQGPKISRSSIGAGPRIRNVKGDFFNDLVKRKSRRRRN